LEKMYGKMNKSNASPDVLIILPNVLEAFTERGGGREARLSQVALALSEDFTVVIVSPFFRRYCKSIKVQDRLTLNNLYFPAAKEYPPRSRFAKLFQSFSAMFYATEAVIKILQLKRRGLRMLLIVDFISGFIPILVAKILNLKILCYEGNTALWEEPNFSPKRPFMRILLTTFVYMLVKVAGKISDAIVVNDGIIKGSMVKLGVKEDKIFVMRAMVDTEKFKPLRIEAEDEDEFTVGFIGRLVKEKGAHLLLELCKTALNELPQVRFIILGDGPFREALKVLPNVKFVKWVPQYEIPSKLSTVKVIVSFQKTFGKSEIEALSCGKPIIASRMGEMPALVKHGEVGLLCEPNVSSYIKTIRFLMENESLLKVLSEKSRMYAVKRFAQKTNYDRWRSLISRILLQTNV